jgi:hypothetical protein
MVTLSAAGLVTTGADGFLIVGPTGLAFNAIGKTVVATDFGATA